MGTERKERPPLFGSNKSVTMAVGKNKRISKGKKGGKKKIVDPFTKKDWYSLKAPTMFSTRTFGQTLVTRTQGTKLASDGLKGRVYEVSLADLNQDEDQAYRKIKLRCDDIQGKNCLTQFHSMDFTKKRMNQIKRSCYAQSAQIRQIRAKMVEIMKQHASTCDLKELVNKFVPEVIGKEIGKACSGIFPLQNVAVRKCKVLKAPRFDVAKLMEVHGDYSEEVAAAAVDRPEEEETKEEETKAEE